MTWQARGTAGGTWKDEWHGLAIARPSDDNARFFQKGSHESFLGRRFQLLKNPRATYKDMVYILINISWWPFTIWILGISVFITLVFAVMYHYVCTDTDDFENAFNLSYQSFSTIGFGILYPRNTCGNITLTLEAFIAMIAISVISGLVFVRFSKPRSTAVFSKQCVIQPYGRDMALVIRVANATRSHDLTDDAILEASFHLNLLRIEPKSSERHEGLVLRRYELPMLQANFLAFRKDVQLVHVIDWESPLFGLTPETCAMSDMALQVDMIGIEATTQGTLQDQALYTADQIEWGVRFVDMFMMDNDQLTMDFRLLSVTEPAIHDGYHDGRTPKQAPTKGPVLTTQFSMKDMVSQSTAHQENTEDYHGGFGKRRDHPLAVDFMTQSLLDTDEPRYSGKQSSKASSIANVEDTPLYDRIVPRYGPLPYSFQTFYSDALKMKWSHIMAVNFISFFAINVVFALLYYVDMPGVYTADEIRNNNTDFAICFYYSVHTLATVGYGSIGPKPSSTFHNFVVMVESTLGIIFITIFTGISWSKFSRPRAHIKFSDHVVVTHIDGVRVMLLRALNLRTHGDISGNSFRLGVAEKNKRTGLRQVHEVDLVNATFPSINLPATLVHVIDEASPFFRFKSDLDFLECNLQMICLYSGIDHTFSANVYARKVYSSQDFFVDEAFVDCAELTTDGVTIHYDAFHEHKPCRWF
ncbi:hypothetical protein LEN26_020552 [Aphanomyces euteiches]|nr:hypothetical protein LEN26_020552 [Aphanomyces euteiches]KAH9194942.1 hypothetical protein AeNC1_003084 [Aphanomyces euteiches]